MPGEYVPQAGISRFIILNTSGLNNDLSLFHRSKYIMWASPTLAGG
jgi:hypothetical protein